MIPEAPDGNNKRNSRILTSTLVILITCVCDATTSIPTHVRHFNGTGLGANDVVC